MELTIIILYLLAIFGVGIYCIQGSGKAAP